MRLALAAAVAFALLSGCAQPSTTRTLHGEELDDALAAHNALHARAAGSPDRDLLPGVSGIPATQLDTYRFANGTVTLEADRGLRCSGSLDLALSLSSRSSDGDWSAGSHLCSVRLRDRPDLDAVAWRAPAMGFTFPVSRLVPLQTLEWRTLEEVRGSERGMNFTRTSFDSGWRQVDLSPRLGDARLDATVLDPCDKPGVVEAAAGAAGSAQVRLDVPVSFTSATLHVRFSDSRIRDAAAQNGSVVWGSSEATVAGDWLAHGVVSVTFALDVEVPDLEAGTPSIQSACATPVLAAVTQSWGATVTAPGLDALQLEAPVQVYLAA